MDLVDALLNGIISGVGMFIVMTILGALTFFFLKPWVIKTVTEIWSEVKKTGVIEIKLDGDKKKK